MMAACLLLLPPTRAIWTVRLFIEGLPGLAGRPEPASCQLQPSCQTWLQFLPRARLTQQRDKQRETVTCVRHLQAQSSESVLDHFCNKQGLSSTYPICCLLQRDFCRASKPQRLSPLGRVVWQACKPYLLKARLQRTKINSVAPVALSQGILGDPYATSTRSRLPDLQRLASVTGLRWSKNWRHTRPPSAQAKRSWC